MLGAVHLPHSRGDTSGLICWLVFWLDARAENHAKRGEPLLRVVGIPIVPVRGADASGLVWNLGPAEEAEALYAKLVAEVGRRRRDSPAADG